MSFSGRRRRKWVFVAIGALLLLVLERYSPFEKPYAPRPRPPLSAPAQPVAAEPKEATEATEAEENRTALEVAAISPDVGVVHPYAAALPDPLPPRAPLPAWQKNAVASHPPSGALRIAIVIDDVGIDRPRSERTLALPAPVTLAFLPYARDVRALARRAREDGHEILVHMPMEPMGGSVDPGPVTLTHAMTPERFNRLLAENLEALDGYVGINNHMGSRLTADPQAMARVMIQMRRRGLLFLDSRTVAQSVAADTAAAFGVPHAARDVFLDNDPDPAAVRAALARLEATARRNGSAIAIGHPKDATLAALESWIPTLEAKGFALVPISALMTVPEKISPATHLVGAQEE